MKVGDVLHASCSDMDYPILAIGKDANGNDCLTIEVEDINDFLDDGEEFGTSEPNLMRSEPERAVFHDVPWKAVEGHPDLIELRTPGGGCYRCTKLFSVKERP